MFNKIKNLIKEKKVDKDFQRSMKDIIRFTVQDNDTGEIETITDNRLGFNNYMVYCWDKTLLNAKVIKRA